MPNRPISVALANAMIKDYIGYMTQHGINMQDQTHCVEFSSDALLGWMGKVSAQADQFRVCFGRYPDGHEHAGRLSAIVWPYKDGKPAKKTTVEGKGGEEDDIEPFNEGSLNP